MESKFDIDLDAPVIPGESAAGIRLGMKIDEILKNFSEDLEHVESSDGLEKNHLDSLFRSKHVALLAKDGIVDQIMVKQSYRGKLLDKVGIGSTIRDIRVLLGKVFEDEEDNLVIEGINGFCFEVDTSRFGTTEWSLVAAPISEMFVFPLENVCDDIFLKYWEEVKDE